MMVILIHARLAQHFLHETEHGIAQIGDQGADHEGLEKVDHAAKPGGNGGEIADDVEENKQNGKYNRGYRENHFPARWLTLIVHGMYLRFFEIL
jgi:hypothetical protein